MLGEETAPTGADDVTLPLGLRAEVLTIFLALRAEAATAEELAGRFPGTDVVAALEQLSAVRLVRAAGELGTWVANPPHVAADELLRMQESAASQQLADIARMRQDFGRIAAEHDLATRPSAALSLAEVIESSEVVRRRIAELSATAVRSVWAAHPSLPPAEALEVGLLLDRERTERGIEVRGLYPHAARRHHLHAQHLRAMQGVGCLVRTASVIPFRAIIIDGETAIVPRAGRDGGAAILRDPVTVSFIAQVFDSLWQGASTPGTEIVAPDEVADEILVSILSELALGHTDETIARRLGISTRTLRRHLAKVADEWNAQTRYQLGMEAQRRFNLSVPHDGEALDG